MAKKASDEEEGEVIDTWQGLVKGIIKAVAQYL
jgi:hypothetical protein